MLSQTSKVCNKKKNHVLVLTVILCSLLHKYTVLCRNKL